MTVGKEDSVHKFSVSIDDYKNYVSKDKMHWEKFILYVPFIPRKKHTIITLESFKNRNHCSIFFFKYSELRSQTYQTAEKY